MGFEPVIPAIERPLICALDRTATAIGPQQCATLNNAMIASLHILPKSLFT